MQPCSLLELVYTWVYTTAIGLQFSSEVFPFLVPREEPNFSYRLMRAICLAFQVLFPNQVVRAADLAAAMVDVVRRTGERQSLVLENRDIRAWFSRFILPWECVLPFQGADRLETVDPRECLHEDAVG